MHNNGFGYDVIIQKLYFYFNDLNTVKFHNISFNLITRDELLFKQEIGLFSIAK